MRVSLRTALPLPCLAAFLATACSSDDIQVDGTYTVTSMWDLSAPFGPDGVGGAVADLVIEEAVTTVVPGLLEDEAIDLVAGLVRRPITDAINGQLSDEMQPDGELYVGLREALGSVEIESDLVLDEDYHGEETVKHIWITRAGGRTELTLGDLPTGVLLKATLEDTDREEKDLYRLEPFTYQLHFGELIYLVARDLLGSNAKGLATAALVCPEVVQAITGGQPDWTFRVAGKDFSISGSDLSSICESVRSLLGEHALGLARLDSGVEMQGKVKLLDPDGDKQADQLVSDEGFEAKVTLVPGPLDPEIRISFVADRK